MEIIFLPTALEDLQHWKKSGNSAILKRIRQLISAINEAPFTGIGKPELLKHDYAGWWSRRIDKEHRLVYMIENENIFIYSLRFHY